MIKLPIHEIVALMESSAIIKQILPYKLKDPGNFTVLCSIEISHNLNALIGLEQVLIWCCCLSTLRIERSKININNPIVTDTTLKHPNGVVKHMLIKVNDLFFLADFIILHIGAQHMPLILERSFLSTAWVLTDFLKGKLILKVEEK